MSALEYGLLISAVGYCVTLLTLALLYFAFRYLPKLLQLRLRARLRKMGQTVLPGEQLPITGDVSAAIATALYLHLNEVHDDEPVKLTIKKISKSYSPWSSKIFGVSRPLRR